MITQIKAIESDYCVVLFKVKCDHLNESYLAIPSYGAVYYVVQGGSNV